MADGSPPTVHSSNMLRNILVGVTTTVLGSSAVYFLGFNYKKDKNSGNNYLVAKEATTKAWRSYVTIDNIYYKNLMSLAKDPEVVADIDTYQKESLKEAARFKQDAEAILKDDDIDKSFVSMLNRRFEREAESQEYISKWFNRIKGIKNSNQSNEEKNRQLMAEFTKFQSYSKGALERAANEIEDLAKALSERYGQPFNLNEFLFYADYKKGLANKDSVNQVTNNNNRPVNPTDQNNQNDQNITNNDRQGNTDLNPQNNNINQPREENNNNQFTSGPGTNPAKLVGNWSTNGAAIILGRDGEMEWYVLSNDDIATGTWKFYNNQLYMYATNTKTKKKATWVFNLSNVTANSFTMKLSVQPYNTYYLVRSQDE